MCYCGCCFESYPYGSNEDCVCRLPKGEECRTYEEEPEEVEEAEEEEEEEEEEIEPEEIDQKK